MEATARIALAGEKMQSYHPSELFNRNHLRRMNMTKEDRLTKFMKKVDKLDECWYWTAYKNKSGYGMFGCYPYGMKLSHRVSWELHRGEIPKGLRVCHHCDNPSCVNPEHLFLGTDLDNVRDMDTKGRRSRTNARYGERNHRSKLTEKDILMIRNSKSTDRELAIELNVCYSTIGYIRRGITWKHIQNMGDVC